ncbi:alkaline phosphatase family protein [Maribacter algarum]|uniref:Alkaline phosphatase family protein n=1 Tax=Maribacter algarum (ex Zhang et al. 2020) TaxID=2578118 RepID=A0A5S3QG79_9FLAO|nr:alkaline phosphatase PafA [Maribacter algarum]TMM56287.1 alkaline phosphatase family protein [Maribacter algarum]
MQKKNQLLLVVLCLILFGTLNGFGQKNQKNNENTNLKTSPKLVVGIVVDQMRYDYLTRFWNHFDEGGFKRLVNEGFNCKNNHFNYAPTSTGPGHTSVYTGAAPATHGVIGNNWYDKEAGISVYCASDDRYTSVGTASEAGKMSPHRMNVTTITDELRLHTQMRGKTVAVALKDRGAVLPGGHTANAAYWFHGADEGDWITSTYYMQELPKWVNDFNASDAVEKYKKPWNTAKVINTYLESGSDNNTYEGLFETEKTPTFPHSTPNLLDKKKDFEIIKYTPYGNRITTDFALAAIEGEDLGKDEATDFLAISYSSTDYIGHKFGVNSKEVQDTYIQLDVDLQNLLNTLDRKVGKDEYTVFLTADHGAIDVPAYLSDQKIPAGYFVYDSIKPKFNAFLQYKFGTANVVKNFSNYQFFLDHKVIKNMDIEVAKVQETIANELLNYKGIDRVYTGHQMMQNNYTKGIPYILQNGYNQKRSGDVLVVLKPGVISYPRTGSTHGSPQIYDTHVPLLFYGKGIRKGSMVNRTEIPDIAPTIATLLGIAFPNGTTGEPIAEVLE